jgi:TonB family protein
VALSFRIGTDGSPKNVAVSATSGYPDLDQAAVACAAQWKYRPALQDGRPVEADWKANVKWSMEPSDQTLNVDMKSPFHFEVAQGRNPVIGSRVCMNPSKPPAPLGKKTVMKFRVMHDGSVEDPKLVQSSGDPVLDGYAFACVASWQYPPWTGPMRNERVVMVVLPW